MNAIIRFASASLASSAREKLAKMGLDLASVDGAGISNKEALLAALGQALGFPVYYGGNWDSAEECLRDAAERAPKGCGLLFERAGGIWQRLPGDMGMLISVWLAAARALQQTDKRLELVFLLEE
jgi:Barstar (barnase inhibitor)